MTLCDDKKHQFSVSECEHERTGGAASPVLL